MRGCGWVSACGCVGGARACACAYSEGGDGCVGGRASGVWARQLSRTRSEPPSPLPVHAKRATLPTPRLIASRACDDSHWHTGSHTHNLSPLSSPPPSRRRAAGGDHRRDRPVHRQHAEPARQRGGGGGLAAAPVAAGGCGGGPGGTGTDGGWVCRHGVQGRAQGRAHCAGMQRAMDHANYYGMDSAALVHPHPCQSLLCAPWRPQVLQTGLFTPRVGRLGGLSPRHELGGGGGGGFPPHPLRSAASDSRPLDPLSSGPLPSADPLSTPPLLYGAGGSGDVAAAGSNLELRRVGGAATTGGAVAGGGGAGAEAGGAGGGGAGAGDALSPAASSTKGGAVGALLGRIRAGSGKLPAADAESKAPLLAGTNTSPSDAA